MTVTHRSGYGTNRVSVLRAVLSRGMIFGLGFSAILSLPFIPDAEQTPRLFDLVSFAALLILLWRLIKLKAAPRYWLTTWGIVFAFALLIISAILTYDVGRVTVLFRVISALAAAIIAAQLSVRMDQIKTLAFGLWAGAAAALLIAFGQAENITGLLSMMPVDRTESAVAGVLRPSAIWGHPNTAAQVTMAGAAMILIAWRKSDNRVVLPLLLYLTIPALNYTVMQNRAPIVVGLIIATLLTIRHRNFYLRLCAVMCVIMLGVILLTDPAILLGERWTGTFSGMTTGDQALERLRSTFDGITIAFERQLGHSNVERESRMLAVTGIRASHNGYVFAMLVIGPWITFFLIVTFLWLLQPLNRKYHIRHVGLAGGSICMMLMFEDGLLEPSIIFTLALVAMISFLERTKVLGVVVEL